MENALSGRGRTLVETLEKELNEANCKIGRCAGKTMKIVQTVESTSANAYAKDECNSGDK